MKYKPEPLMEEKDGVVLPGDAEYVVKGWDVHIEDGYGGGYVFSSQDDAMIFSLLLEIRDLAEEDEKDVVQDFTIIEELPKEERTGEWKKKVRGFYKTGERFAKLQFPSERSTDSVMHIVQNAINSLAEHDEIESDDEINVHKRGDELYLSRKSLMEVDDGD